jgi:hypothetical protein
MLTLTETDEFNDQGSSSAANKPLAITDASQPPKKKQRRVRQLKRKNTVS